MFINILYLLQRFYSILNIQNPISNIEYHMEANTFNLIFNINPAITRRNVKAFEP